MSKTINNRYRLTEKLKERKNYVTYRANDLKEQREVAIKIFDLKKCSEAEINKIKNDLNILLNVMNHLILYPRCILFMNIAMIICLIK